MTSTTGTPRIDTLVLDAGPLIARTSLRGLARRIVTTPQVVAELKDPRVRAYWERLPLLEGVSVEIRSPNVTSMAEATAMTKKFGDYSTLSQPDIAIIALTYELHRLAALTSVNPTVGGPAATLLDANHSDPGAGTELSEELDRLRLTTKDSSTAEIGSSYAASTTEATDAPELETDVQTEISIVQSEESPSLFEDPSDDDDGDGEWITPENVKKHQEKAGGVSMVPDKNAPVETLSVACMTADFAMQNSLLRMGLNLVSYEGLRVKTVKTSVLRCHACFKLCKDQTKKFCPSCGGPTLRRTTVSLKAGDGTSAPQLQVHLKRNFQWKLKGTQADLPPPRMGHARGGGEAAIILREDQKEWQRGVWSEATRQRKEEKRQLKAVTEKEKRGDGVWNDPEWVPQLLVGGTTGGGRMPTIGVPRGKPKPRKR